MPGKSKITKNKFSKVLSLFTKDDRQKMIYIVLGMLIMSIIEIIGVSSVAPFMAIVVDPEIIHTNIYISKIFNYFNFSEKEFITFFGITILIVMILSNSFSAYMTWKIHYFSNMQTYLLSTRLMKSYIFQNYEFFLNTNSSELSKNMFAEIDRIIGGIVFPSMAIIAKTSASMLIFAMLMIVDPIVAVSSVIVLGLSYFVIYNFVSKELTSIGKETSKYSKLRYKYANEALLGVKEVIIQNVEHYFIDRFALASKQFAKKLALSNIISTLPRFLIETIAFGGLIGLVIFLVHNGRNSSDIIILLSLYAIAGYKLLPALQGIYMSITQIRYHMPAVELIAKDFSQLTKETVNDSNSEISILFNKEISLIDLNFRYSRSDKNILSNINLTIPVHTTIGFVGKTGSGKSTLIDLIIGILPSKKGSLMVDNVAITDKNVGQWYKKIGYVSQHIYLMDASLAENIAFGISKEKIDFNLVEQALKDADLLSFCNSLPNGYNTNIGEQGVKLSGGQQQRIGIARALYHSPELLVLDEATSSLDNITEDKIMRSIKNISQNKTVIIIAHRLTTIQNCDLIYFMEDGLIIDSGSYHELNSKNKKFKNMSKKL